MIDVAERRQWILAIPADDADVKMLDHLRELRVVDTVIRCSRPVTVRASIVNLAGLIRESSCSSWWIDDALRWLPTERSYPRDIWVWLDPEERADIVFIARQLRTTMGRAGLAAVRLFHDVYVETT